MKTVAFMISALLLSTSFTSNAQKGYYSIGQNAAKLGSPSGIQVFSGFKASKKKTAPAVQKGYYTTGNNREKLSEQVSFEQVKPSVQSYYKLTPVKGYYSIGRNAEKLN